MISSISATITTTTTTADDVFDQGMEHWWAGEPLLTGFAANRYVAPMLLGEGWKRLDAFHGTNMAEPEWADDVVKAQADLWHAVPCGAELLRFWWCAASVVTWRRQPR